MDEGDKIKDVIASLAEMKQDDAVPKNVRMKICVTLESLNQNDKSLALKINKSLEELEEISDDPNIPADIRSKIWEVVSLLSSI